MTALRQPTPETFDLHLHAVTGRPGLRPRFHRIIVTNPADGRRGIFPRRANRRISHHRNDPLTDDDTNVDKQELIDGLNTDLAHEYQAVLMYNTYAAMASGIHRPILKTFFESEIADELQHAAFLANKITALGGRPTTAAAPLDVVDDSRGMLEQVQKAEADTIKRYVERRRQAEAYEDYGLAADLDEIISDETEHKEETEKLLRNLGEEPGRSL